MGVQRTKYKEECNHDISDSVAMLVKENLKPNIPPIGQVNSDDFRRDRLYNREVESVFKDHGHVLHVLYEKYRNFKPVGGSALFSVPQWMQLLQDTRMVGGDPGFDLTARAGYLVNDKTLVYLRGGYANTRVRATLASDTDVVTTSDNLDGWLVGGGVERALTDDISARLEYRYTDLGSDGGEFDQHQALVGISYNF